MKRSPESFSVAAMLALTGGFLEAYTFLCRDGVFANAQTGNVALLAISLVNGEFLKAVRYLIPILAFVAGVSVAIWMCRRPPKSAAFGWRHGAVLLEILLVAAVGCIPAGRVGNMIANVMVSFVCAVQAESFRTVLGTPFASIMCTANLRSATEYLHQFFADKEKTVLQKSLQYFGIDGIFLCGAALGAVATKFCGTYAALCGCLLLGLVFWQLKKE